jgi:predicted dehydrogenase
MTDQRTFRAGVFGVGALGRHHTRILNAMSGVELVGIYDSNPETAREVATEHGAKVAASFEELAAAIDIAVLAVPTVLHAELGIRLLERGIHLLVEKPIAASLEQADELVRLARSFDRVLQVGHLERFNAALLSLEDVLVRPLFVESHRLAPFKPRGTDVDVILDLMIHDIDLIQLLVGAPLARAEAVGVPVLSERDDIANARLHFEGGCVANVTASRVSLKSERKMRLFQKDAYVSIDFMAGEATIARKGPREMFPGVPDIGIERRHIQENDPLRLEIEAFLAAIRGERTVAVSGEDGRRALDGALQITRALRRPA